MRGVSLFAGAVDGLAIAFEAAGVHVSHHVEWDSWCCDVLRRNFPGSQTINRDIHEVTGHDFGFTALDVLFGSPPCQGFSVAGKQAGFADERYLWPQMFRLVRETNPRVVLVENVRGSVPEDGDNLADAVLRDLESEGYTGAAYLVPACLFGAPHERYRVFIVAYTERVRPHGKAAIQNPSADKKRYMAACKQSGRPVIHAGFSSGHFVGYSRSECVEGKRRFRSESASARRFAGKSQGTGYRARLSSSHQSRLDRAAHGPAGWLDGLNPTADFPGWPAGQGAFQHGYEPARTTAEKGAHHKERLQALGNAVVWQQALPFAQAIAAWLKEHES